ncbi:MAG TPA: hypothetical protein P5279_02795 [Anaerohalosphaeraceae bacterium]|jgi:hypothetical protein|nr:hypothetical protein [Anaerohalosphaeraceae bacterium]HRT49397.1 hypothetical protein [Anaerohalosphaeraceae bacterium]HRT87390.1 hypothetical protein [Anaerohalosphaeraceae bacterium]
MFEALHNSRITHLHVPGAHKLQQLLRDERFWAIFAIVVILALLITLAIIAGQGTGGGPQYTPMYPYYP